MSSCKVSVQGNVVEVTWIDCKNSSCHAIKLDGEHWVDPETGEIHEYEKHSELYRVTRAVLAVNPRDLYHVSLNGHLAATHATPSQRAVGLTPDVVELTASPTIPLQPRHTPAGQGSA